MKKKYIKLAIILVIVIIVSILLVLIYQNLFAGGNSPRNTDIINYKITNNEINATKDKIQEIEEVKSVDIHTNNNSKIIKIVVVLSSDVDFDKIKAMANECITNFSEENIAYYDFEFYVDSENQDSEVYPKIGYKFRSSLEFSW